MSIEGQGQFFTIYFPGFVCFVLYLDKISGERLQNYWSSGFRIATAWFFALIQSYNSVNRKLKLNISNDLKLMELPGRIYPFASN